MPVLLHLGLYFVAMLAAMSVLSLPLAPATLIAVRSAPPWVVALVASSAAALAAVFDYWFVRKVFRLRALERLRTRRLFQRAERCAAVAPFWTTAAFAGFPVPFTIVRVLVPLSGYPRARYVAAVALGRFPRIFVIATFGTLYQIPLPILVTLFAITLAIGLAVAITRQLRFTRPTDPPLPPEQH